MKFEDMLKFALGFMPKNLQSLIFFIPLFLLNLIFMVGAYFILGDLIANQVELGRLIVDVMASSSITNIFSIPQIQNILGFSLLFGVLGWILSSYATICVLKAAELEHKKKRWNAKEMLNMFVGILPRYLGLVIMAGIIISIPLIASGAIIIGIVTSTTSISEGPIHAGTIMPIVSILASFLIIPGAILLLYLGIRLYAAAIALVIEDKGIIESLKRSWSLTKGSWWYVFLYSILFGIIITIISVILGLPVMVIGFFEKPLISIAPISSILNYFIGFYTTAAYVAFSYMIYLSLIEREEEKPTAQ